MIRRLSCHAFVWLLFASSLHAQWFDSFDSYNVGPLAFQSDWEEFTGKTGVDASVTDQRAFSGTQSVFIVGTDDPGDDVVFNFANLPGGQMVSGQWIYSIKTYVGSAAQGTGSISLMNRYPTLFNASVVVRFNADANIVVSDGSGMEELPLIRDQWVNVIVCVDIDTDRFDAFYGDDILIENASWRFDHDRGGPARFAAVRLWGRNSSSTPPGTSGMFLDNPRLEENSGPCLALNASPNPVTAGQTLKIKVTGPTLANAPFGLFVWSLQGAPFVLPVLTGTLDGTGVFSVEALIPNDIGILDIGFKAFASSPGLTQSNEDVVIFQ